jgi:hypothetical protein
MLEFCILGHFDNSRPKVRFGFVRSAMSFTYVPLLSPLFFGLIFSLGSHLNIEIKGSLLSPANQNKRRPSMYKIRGNCFYQLEMSDAW